MAPMMDPVNMMRQFQMMMSGGMPMGGMQGQNMMPFMGQGMGNNTMTTGRGGRNLPPRGFGGFQNNNKFQGQQQFP